MISYAAHLRVYEPLAAFPDDERRHWTDYIESGGVPDRVTGAEREHAAALAALLAVPPRPAPPAEAEGAFVRQDGGVSYVCPMRTRLRCWAALADFRRGLPDEVADAFVPHQVAEAAAVEAADFARTHPEVRPSILTSTWQVPIPWFLLFDPRERQVVLGERRTSTRPQARARTGLERALLYVTPMARARQRIARALHVVRRTLEDGPAVAGVEDLGRWLEEFHPHALVELDYGGLVHLLDDEELSADDSVAALAAALGHLADGDAVNAAGLYEQVTTRWRAIASLEAAN